MKTNRLTLIRGWAAALLLATALLMPQAVAAYDFMVDGLCYNKYQNDEVEVTFIKEYREDAEDDQDYDIVPYHLTGEIIIPSSVTYSGTTYRVIGIDKYSFENCTGITSITIPKSVKSIGNYAFRGCSNLENIVFEDALWDCYITSMGKDVFDGTKWFSNQPTGMTYLADGRIAYKYKGDVNIIDRNFKFDYKVSVIAGRCFANKGVCEVDFASVKYIGEEAFDFSSLKYANLKNVVSVGVKAFQSCYNLEEVVLGTKISSVYGCAFADTHSLKNVYIKATTKPSFYTYADWTWDDGSGGAFYGFNCSGITIYVPSNLIEAYSNDWGLTTSDYTNRQITFEELIEVSYISSIQSEKTEILVGEQLSLSAICKPDNASHKKCEWYVNYSNVVSVDNDGLVTGLREGTVTITAYPVCGNGSQSITITVSFPAVTIGDFTYKIDEANHSACAKASNKNVTSLDGVLSQVEYEGVVYPVTKISDFIDCTNITELTIPNFIQKVEDGCFSRCEFEKATIPASVTVIGQQAFFNCTSLKEVVFEDGDEDILLGNSKYSDGIGGGLFEYCPIETAYIGRNINVSNYHDSYNRPYSNAPFSRWYANSYTPMKTATIAANVTKLCDYFFERCNAVETLTCYVSDPSQIVLGQNVFRHIPKSTCVLQVPAGSMAAYQAAEQWQEFTNIVEMEPPTVLATSLTLNETAAEVTAGETLQLTATVLPENATDRTVTWTSSDPAVANVDATGLVTAVAAGTATITATTNDGSALTAICEVTVNPAAILATSVSLDQSNVSLTEGMALQLTATVLPDDATDKSVTWSSNNEAVATVDATGLVTAVAAGTATITATTSDGSALAATCAVTVNPAAILATSVSLDQSNVSLTEGMTLQLTATVQPEDATDKSVTWNSSDLAVATVDENGLVTAVVAGTAIITATTNDGSNLAASCEITVEATAANRLKVENCTVLRGNTLIFPVQLVNASDNLTALQADIHLPQGVTIEMDGDDYVIDLVSQRVGSDHTLSSNRLASGAVRVLIASPTKKLFTGNDGDLFTICLLTSDEMSAGDYAVTIDNIILSDNQATTYLTPDVTSTITVKDVEMGDATGDGQINVGDYVATAGYILEEDPQPFVFAAADIDANGTIDVGDLVGVAGIILSTEAPAGMPAHQAAASGTANLGVKCNSTGDGHYLVTIDMSNDASVTAMQMDLTLPDGLRLADASLTDRASGSHAVDFNRLHNGDWRVLAASGSNKAFRDSEGAVLTLELEGDGEGNCSIENIMLAQPNGARIVHDNLNFEVGLTTGVTDVYSKVNIYVQGDMLIVDSPHDTVAQLVMPNGTSQRLRVSAGRNVYRLGNVGYVFVKVDNQVAKFRF